MRRAAWEGGEDVPADVISDTGEYNGLRASSGRPTESWKGASEAAALLLANLKALADRSFHDRAGIAGRDYEEPAASGAGRERALEEQACWLVGRILYFLREASGFDVSSHDLDQHASRPCNGCLDTPAGWCLAASVPLCRRDGLCTVLLAADYGRIFP